MLRAVLVCVLSGYAMGCASWFLNGAKMADRDYAQDTRSGWTAEKCKSTADNSEIAGGAATYHLVTTGKDTGLFERSADGTGALIQNRWRAPDGDHYFAWVQRTGWEYVIPTAGTPRRIVYTGLKTEKSADGTSRPATQPSATCEMVPSGTT